MFNISPVEKLNLLHGVKSNFCIRFLLLNYCNTIEYSKNISRIHLLAFMLFIGFDEVFAEVVTKGVRKPKLNTWKIRRI